MVGCGTINFPLKRQRTLGSQSPSLGSCGGLLPGSLQDPKRDEESVLWKKRINIYKKNETSFRVDVAPLRQGIRNFYFWLTCPRVRAREDGTRMAVVCGVREARRNEFLFICFNFCIPVSKQKINRFQWKLFVLSSQNNKYRTTNQTRNPSVGH